MICSLTIANVKQLVVYLALLAVFTIGSAMKSFPFLKSFICESFDLVTHSKLPLEQYWNSLFSWEMLHNVWHCVFLDLNKKVSLGNRAYNCPVVSVDGQNCFRLLDQMKSNRPLVLNFGSASCPIFMEHLKEFARMVKEFGHVADFLIVYIEEAHPSDGWKFENNNSIAAHQTQVERCTAAQILSPRDFPCPVVVDTMLDAVNIAYGAAPIRMYIVENNDIVYEGGAGPMGYRMEQVRQWLRERT